MEAKTNQQNQQAATMENAAQTAQAAPKVSKEIVTIMQDKIDKLTIEGNLKFPADYSPKNALMAAWLILQGVKDKNDRPVLETCTRDSIMFAMQDMVVQGLNPIKKQCYFIPYGNKLTCFRSYFGTRHLCLMLTGAKDIWADVVYEGDVFEYDMERGRKRWVKHEQKLENIDNDKIVAAYCVIEFEDESKNYMDVMTIEQIRKSWSKSMTKGNGTVHKDFTVEMCKRTVTNRACKPLINQTNDSVLMFEALNRTRQIETDAAMEAEIIENANATPIDIGEDKPEQIETKQEIVEAAVSEQTAAPKQEAKKEETAPFA